MTAAVPAEFSPHRAMWLGFPSHAELWLDDLAAAQAEAAALARALAGPGGEHVRLLVCGADAEAAAKALLGEVAGIEITPGRFGDIWLRDTGPIFGAPGAAAGGFRFNGWGGKYVLEGDETVAAQLAAHAGAALTSHDFVLEGGALDHDGEGTVLTTRECLLNPNRNRGWTQAVAEAALAEALGAKKVIWLERGLLNDHTDGHVDNLARFIAPGVVAIPIAFGAEDPHAQVFDDAARALAGATDAAGRPIRVVRIPAPGRVPGEDGTWAPASHMNFIIANRAVIYPTYNAAPAAMARKAFEALFPGRAAIGLPSTALLTGGGSFHCISQQEPA
ncbi:MAG TPA: agmatine deiminase family protein [Caulobacteraceae bacterium]|jgi:agmatine deiminase